MLPILYFCQAAQQRFDDALDRAYLKGLTTLLENHGTSVDPTIRDQQALRLACERGSLPLLDLLLQHPLTHPETDHLNVAIAKNNCDIVEKLIIDGRVDVSLLYKTRLGISMGYLLNDIPLGLLQACTENSPEYICKFNPVKLRPSQLDMLVARAGRSERSRQALSLIQLINIGVPRRDVKVLELMLKHPEWKTSELTYLLKPWVAAQLGLRGAIPEDIVDRIAEFCIPDPMTWRTSLKPHFEFALSLYSIAVLFQLLESLYCEPCAYFFSVATLLQAVRLGFNRQRRQFSLSRILVLLLLLDGIALMLFIGTIPLLDVGDTDYRFHQLTYVLTVLYVHLTADKK